MNSVVYDSGIISMEQIEELLINSVTYIQTMSWQDLGKKKMEK